MSWAAQLGSVVGSAGLALLFVARRQDFRVAGLAAWALGLGGLAAYLAPDLSATKLAVGGLGAFLGWTDDFRVEGLITAPLLGVLITMADQRTRVAREVTDALRGSDLPLFDTVVPRRTAAEDQVGDRLVFSDPGANPDLAQAYAAFTQEVIERTGVRGG